jgi:hypothetical protein
MPNVSRQARQYPTVKGREEIGRFLRQVAELVPPRNLDAVDPPPLPVVLAPKPREVRRLPAADTPAPYAVTVWWLVAAVVLPILALEVLIRPIQGEAAWAVAEAVAGTLGLAGLWGVLPALGRRIGPWVRPRPPSKAERAVIGSRPREPWVWRPSVPLAPTPEAVLLIMFSLTAVMVGVQFLWFWRHVRDLLAAHAATSLVLLGMDSLCVLMVLAVGLRERLRRSPTRTALSKPLPDARPGDLHDPWLDA